MMKKLFTLLALGLSLSLSAAYAADAPAAPAAPAVKTAQQSKMVTCNKDATGKKGDERKAFMKECLSAKPAAAASAATTKEVPGAAKEATGTTQQSKMKTCNADAKGKKGSERKAFMSECLKK